VALAVAVGVALSALIVAWQATSRLARVSQVDPWTFLQQRDRGHRFTVESYGFAYRGESGNLIDDEILMFGAFEKERLFFMRDFLAGLAGSGGPDAPVVIDVGANTGNHSLFLSRLSGTVHAFEPFPPVIQRFKNNLRLNPGIDNVVLHEVGLGDLDVTLPFVAPPANNQGMGTFRADAESARGGEVYETPLHIVVGDNWLADIDLTGLVLIKIDVEGFEEPVLLGLVRTLARHRPLVVVEVSPPSLGGTIASFEQLAGLLPERYEFLAFGPRSVEAALTGAYTLRPLTSIDFTGGKIVEAVAVPVEMSSLVPHR
jgi:FkbM family methyltransferase